VIFGWDISTAIVGLTVMDSSGSWKSSTFLDLRKTEDDTQKLEKFKEFVYVETARAATSSYDQEHYHFVEDRLAGFTRGFTNAGTMMKLGAFHHTCCWIIYECFVHLRKRTKIIKLHPTTVKAQVGLKVPKGGDKKGLTLALVRAFQPDFAVTLNRNDKPQPYCYDMADSYIVAKAGVRKHLCK
jgi:hypothetical protein